MLKGVAGKSKSYLDSHYLKLDGSNANQAVDLGNYSLRASTIYAAPFSGTGFQGGSFNVGSGGYFQYFHQEGYNGIDYFQMVSLDPNDEFGVGGGLEMRISAEEGGVFGTYSGNNFQTSGGVTSANFAGYPFAYADGGGYQFGSPSSGLASDAYGLWIFNDRVRLQSGTALLPILTPEADTNTGLLFPAPDTQAWATGGVEAMRIDSAQKVGIGGVSGGANLDVRGTGSRTVRVFSDSTNGTANLQLGNTNNGQINLSINGGTNFSAQHTSGAEFLYAVRGGALLLNTANATGVLNGNVTIGSTAANAVAALNVFKTTEQFRVGYNTSNYWNAITASNGYTAFNIFGTAQSFSMGDTCSVSLTGTAIKGVAMGQNSSATLATGQSKSFASGIDCAASGNNSIAMGVGNSGAGQNIGWNNTMSFGIGVGKNNIGQGTSIGAGCNTGSSGTCMGTSASALGSFGTSLGLGTVAGGFFSTAVGAYCTASAQSSVSIGGGCQSTATGSVSIGLSVNATAVNSAIMGYSAVGITNATTNSLMLAYEGTNFLLDANRIAASKPIKLQGYTVATLPAGAIGDTAYVTDALAPTFLAILVGGGAVVTTCFFNGVNWVAQ